MGARPRSADSPDRCVDACLAVAVGLLAIVTVWLTVRVCNGFGLAPDEGDGPQNPQTPSLATPEK